MNGPHSENVLSAYFGRLSCSVTTAFESFDYTQETPDFCIHIRKLPIPARQIVGPLLQTETLRVRNCGPKQWAPLFWTICNKRPG